MIPILYAQGKTSFTSNGIGKLADAESCVVTEERNGAFELSMTYPVSGRHFADLRPGNIILVKPSWAQDPQPFDIKTVTPSTSKMDAEIYAQHISYRLSGVPVKPFTASGIAAALNGLIANSMVSHGFEVWTDISNDTSTFTLKKPQSFRACLGGTQGSILQTFSGSGSLEYLFDGKIVKAYRNRGRDNGVIIKYGKNLTSLKQEESIETTYTGVLAYWQDGQTGDTVSGQIQYAANHSSFAQERIFILDASSDFENQKPSEDDLTLKAADYVLANNIGKPSVNLSVSFADLSQTDEYKNIAPLERVNLCDTVKVYFQLLGVDSEAKVVKTEWDVLMDRYDKIELGDAKSSFADTIKQEAHEAVAPEIKQSVSFLQQAIDKASDLLKGGAAGHMVIGTNANGESNELYFMDTTDRATAKNVLRINMNGIAFSTTGINGTYTTAWTIDGKFVADFITAGTLNGTLVKTGMISDSSGRNTWNLDTGELKITSISNLRDKVNEILTYMYYDTSGLHLGKRGSAIRLDVTNDRLSFFDTQSGKEIAYFAAAMMYILSGVFVERLQIGNFGFVPRPNGSLDFKKVNS